MKYFHKKYALMLAISICGATANANKFNALGTSGPLVQLDNAMNGSAFTECLEFEFQMDLNETRSRTLWHEARDAYEECVRSESERINEKFSAATTHLKKAKKTKSLEALTASYLEWQKMIDLQIPSRNESGSEKRLRSLDLRRAKASYKAHANIYYDKLIIEK